MTRPHLREDMWELTVEMRRVNVETYDRARRPKADDAP